MNMSDLALDISFERARVVHRIVRAMHDGECPKCHRLFRSHQMYTRANCISCPICDFQITAPEIQAAINEFAVVMDRNLTIFEEWRKTI
jgi:hypothetical protein